jgi:DNA-binding NarL/FixJ family response regulator
MSIARATGTSVRVLVIDADRRVRQSLTGLVELTDDLTVVGAVADAPSAIQRLEAAPADVVLLDLRLPEVDAGLALLAELHRRWPELALIAMSCSEDLAAPSLSNGALAFVPKSGQPEELIETLRRSGRSAWDRSVPAAQAAEPKGRSGSG